jgi:hypothetical protein
MSSFGSSWIGGNFAAPGIRGIDGTSVSTAGWPAEFEQLVCCLSGLLDPAEEWEVLSLHVYRDIDDIGNPDQWRGGRKTRRDSQE